MSKQAFKRMRKHLKLTVSRDPLPAYAWPGGYPIFYVFMDGGVICPKCINDNIEQIDEAVRSKYGNMPHSSGCGGWAVDDMDCHWEGEPMNCDNCGGQIESAYGPVEGS